MTKSHFSIDRFTILLLAMTATLPFMAVGPALATPAQPSCQIEAQTIRDAAENAPPEKASKAVRNANLGEKICAAGNRREAGKKFAQGWRQLDANVQYAAQR